MPVDVIMPALGLAQETGTVLRWLKEDGAAVVKGEALLEVETDKVTVEVEAPADGTLAGVKAPAGAEVPVGSVIALVFAQGEEPGDVAAPLAALDPATVPAVPAVARQAVRPRKRLASPKARRLAETRGVDLDALVGSGPGGAVVAADVERADRRGVAADGLAVGSVWRRMAERTTRAWQEAPQFALSREVDASRLQTWRDAARRRPGLEHVSITDLLVRVCAEALKRHPRVAASWHEGTLVAGPVDVGVAVATDEGLVVPVVHDAGALSLAAISARRRELTEAARAGRLRPENVRGGVFTISNLGMYAIDDFQAIVNAPQAAILAVGRILDRPVVVAGEVVVRPVVTLTVSFDHRVVDGARGAEFLETLSSLVEEPAGLVE
jgi:pyruvate dehydrogenase E2 component (dihydrolipoamide acetyltransferase)